MRASATWPTLNTSFIGETRRAICQQSAPAAAPSVGAPGGASTIAATQTASASENSSSSPSCETESVKRSAATLATMIANAAVSVRTGASATSPIRQARIAAPGGRHERDEDPRRRGQARRRGGRYRHSPVQNLAVQNFAVQNFASKPASGAEAAPQ